MGSAPVCGVSLESKGPSIAQSCGRRTCPHCESSNSGVSAPWASPLKNRHSVLKLMRRAREMETMGAAAGVADARTGIASVQQMIQTRHRVSVIGAPRSGLVLPTAQMLVGLSEAGLQNKTQPNHWHIAD